MNANNNLLVLIVLVLLGCEKKPVEVTLDNLQYRDKYREVLIKNNVDFYMNTEGAFVIDNIYDLEKLNEVTKEYNDWVDKDIERQNSKIPSKRGRTTPSH